jgi:hypothetical protein
MNGLPGFNDYIGAFCWLTPQIPTMLFGNAWAWLFTENPWQNKQ